MNYCCHARGYYRAVLLSTPSRTDRRTDASHKPSVFANQPVFSSIPLAETAGPGRHLWLELRLAAPPPNLESSDYLLVMYPPTL